MKKPTQKQIMKELLERRRIGNLLSNCAYNLAQSDSLAKRDQEILNDLRKLWDTIKSV